MPDDPTIPDKVEPDPKLDTGLEVPDTETILGKSAKPGQTQTR